MSKLVVCAFLFFGMGAIRLLAQGSSPAAASPGIQSDVAGEEAKKAATANRADQPVTTEIYSDKAFFDSEKYLGVFTGRVIVKDPRFNIQSDKLTLYMSREPNQGVEKAVAEGNVGVVQDRADPKGGPPKRAVGRAEAAVYTAKDGNIEMTGMPRVQNGLNIHVATSAETVMVLNESGQLTTRGPSRTEIRQEMKVETAKP